MNFMFDDDEEESVSSSGEQEDGFELDCDDEPPRQKHKYSVHEDFHYEILTPETLVTYMNQVIDEVNNVFQVGEPTLLEFAALA